ncbi:VOC family protein [Erysipelothrix tonsillarum]|uniref:VOC family protein n=1 Tax=Erysipelothrix tonsillarum TaxID=38402 RepID=UPI000378B9F6|nr:VOC family protein [Erysipelothrix tonsillarum]
MKNLNNIKLKNIVLRVHNLSTMQHFYEMIMGLEVIRKEKETVLLGVDGNVLITLSAIEPYEMPQHNAIGLYHLALLLPNEAYLGQFLRHLINLNQSITGLGDHLYSQAIYFNDPEGNGIEVYADRPRSMWTIDDKGMIEGGTKAVDIEKLMSTAYTTAWKVMPLGTTMGHVHLQVPNIQQARKFYIDSLGFELKTEMSQALFISKDGYHHHIGINAWAGPHLEHLPAQFTGMESFTIALDDLDGYRRELMNRGIETVDIDEKHFTIEDPFHIKIIFEKN